MSNPLQRWERKQFTPTDGRPLLFYVVFGTFSESLPPLSRSKYQCDGLPDGIDVWHYSSETQPEVLDSFREDYVWNEFQHSDPGVADRVLSASECMILKGELPDQPDLNYLRNVNGYVTYLLDNGGVAVNDLQTLCWRSAEQWRNEVFLPGKSGLSKQVVILSSEEGDGTVWLHTRGLRKFGRPDVSIHRVEADRLDAATALCQRLIHFLMHGGVVSEGQPAKIDEPSLSGLCRIGGDLDDPDFNNRHIEVVLQDEQ